jgi:dipeptidyl-peptidase 4
MTPVRSLLVVAACLAPLAPLASQVPTYTIDQFLSPASPLEMSAARKADRLAWVSYEKGMRNIYVAAGPGFKATRITRFLADDGVDLGSVKLSDDGSLAIFVRGHGQNREGWVANPSHDPRGADRAVWAARTDGSGAWRLASIASTQPGAGRGGAPELSPDGRYVVFARDGQIYRASTARGPKTAMDTAGVPFIKA